MNYRLQRLMWAAICATVLAGSSSGQAASNARRSLADLHPIDAHAHVLQSNPAIAGFLERWNLHIVDILVVDDKAPTHGPLNRQRAAALAFIHSAHGHASLCTTFDPFRLSQPDFLKTAIDQLNQDFDNGAVAVKVWKNVGMELKDGSGRYVMVDDPRLEPIFQDIAAHNKTLIAHQAEPNVSWIPDSKAIDNSYYAEHPEWNMSKVPGAPSKAAVIASRDHLLAENPKLRVIGAHLGSMESDVDLVAQRLDRYPNFAVDTAARVPHLTIQPRAKVRAFLIKYQDRVLYGTDSDIIRQSDVKPSVAEWEKQLAEDWRYFSTADTFNYDGHMVKGLQLPLPVLRKLYHDNAVHWIPGVAAAGMQ
ncbi:MAG TPA: amidohydrolase family protein [Edaphobacter sp.]|nr:amidohydrolase family protein [Edaphobacter sp.]